MGADKDIKENRRILVIDDDKETLVTYKNILSPEKEPIERLDKLAGKNNKASLENYDLILAGQGQEGFELFKKALDDEMPFAAVFIDMGMPPVWDGLETAQQIRQLDDRVYIIIVTACADHTIGELQEAVGHNLLYVRKPFFEDEIYQLAHNSCKSWDRDSELKKFKDRLEETIATRTVELRKEITDHGQTEDEMKEAKKYLDNIIESSLDCIIVTNKGFITRTNRAFVNLVGYKEEELSGKPMSELIPREGGEYTSTSGETVQIDEDFIDSSKKIQAKLLKNEKISNRELFYLRKDGKVVPVEENIAVLRDEKEAVIGSVWSVRDITCRKKAAKEIRDARDFLEKVFESSMDGILVTDKKGTVLSANTAVERIYGLSRQQLIGNHVSMLADRDANSREKALRTINELFEKGFAFFDSSIRTRDGRAVDVEGTTTMIKDEKGCFSEGVTIIRDVSERKKIHQQLQQSQKMEAIGTLASGIAHDFNNILAAIMGYTEMSLADVPDNSPVKENLEQIFRSSTRARDLVKQILSFSRKSDQDLKPLQLHLVIEEAVKLLRASLPTNIEIKQDINNRCGMVLTDPTQIHQVIMNLCTNAAHAMEKKGGELKVGLYPADIAPEDAAVNPDLKPGPHVKLTVSDTGTGIDPQLAGRIFDPFFTTKGTDKGTGMGLSVVHGIVKSHGGAITLQNAPGKGATFEILLPRAGEEKAADQQEMKEPVPPGTECVLFVDDEEVLVSLGKRMLESLGYNVVAEKSSVRALEIFKTEPDKFDIVITDQTMPQMTGYGLAEQIVSIRPDMPVILCTGFSDPELTEKAESAGIREVIMKPVNRNELALKIRRVLENR